MPQSSLVLASCVSSQCNAWHRISGGEKRFIKLIVLEVQHPGLGTLTSVALDKGGRGGHTVLGKQVGAEGSISSRKKREWLEPVSGFPKD